MQVGSLSSHSCGASKEDTQSAVLILWGEGHILTNSPVRPPRPAVSTIQLAPNISPLTRTTVHVLTTNLCFCIDSGSAGNLISHQLLQKLNVRRKRCSQKLTIRTIQRKQLGRGRISHFSPTLTLHIGCLHLKKISFRVLEGYTADIIPPLDVATPTSNKLEHGRDPEVERILSSELFNSCYQVFSPSLSKSIQSSPT